MADPLQTFVDAKNAYFERLANLRTEMAALEKEQDVVLDLGRAAKITVSGVRDMVPRFSFKIDWPEGLEPPVAAEPGS